MMPLRSASVTRGPDSGRGGRLELVDNEGGYEVCAAGSACGRASLGGDELLDAVCMARCEARCGNVCHHQLRRATLRGRGSGSCLPLTAPVSRDCLTWGGDEVGIVGTRTTRRGRRAGVEDVSSPEASKRGRFGSGSTAGEALEDMA
jgi:hypothetical protein